MGDHLGEDELVEPVAQIDGIDVVYYLKRSTAGQRVKGDAHRIPNPRTL